MSTYTASKMSVDNDGWTIVELLFKGRDAGVVSNFPGCSWFVEGCDAWAIGQTVDVAVIDNEPIGQYAYLGPMADVLLEANVAFRTKHLGGGYDDLIFAEQGQAEAAFRAAGLLPTGEVVNKGTNTYQGERWRTAADMSEALTLLEATG
jgi:hypothetical protein